MLLPAEPVPGPAGPPAANLATEFTSGSFTDFFAADDDELVDDAAPAAAATGAGDAAGFAASAKQRPRVLTLAVAIAVLAVAAVAAGLTLLHQRPGQQAQTSLSLGVVPTSSASAAPTPPASATPVPSASATHPPPAMLTLIATPAQQAAPTPAGHWPAWSGNLDHYQSLLAAEQALLRARQRLQLVPHLPLRGPWPALRRGAPPHFGGPHGGFHRR